MKKYQYILLWFIYFVIFDILLYYSTSIISRTVIDHLFLQFEIVLPIIGFSMIMSTLIICTTIILSKLNQNNSDE
ncbi:MAG: hypothetical protein ACRDD4_09085, partial [Culicoidibacterales bacterium]